MAPRTPHHIYSFFFFFPNFLIGSIEKRREGEEKKYSHWVNHGEEKKKSGKRIKKKVWEGKK